MSDPLRYVVLRHEGVESPHFDLMFESSPGSALVTFRSLEWPIGKETPVERLPDHRAAYLTYEGPVSGNRGYVRRVESGTYQGSINANGSSTIVLEPSGIRLQFTGFAAGQWTVRHDQSSRP